MTVIVWPYNERSMSAKAILRAVPEFVSVYRQHPRKNDVLLNWGVVRNGYDHEVARVINPAHKTVLASDKREFFRAVKDHARVPPSTENAKTAWGWSREGEVVGRGKVAASGGKGIVFSSDGDLHEFMNCKLFTKFIPSDSEYRIHIAFGKVIDVTKKGLRKEVARDRVDARVRSHRNGFIFLRQNIVAPKDVQDQAMLAHNALGLDFAAYDVLWTGREAYVLEANTAPGIEGTTVERYAAAFREELLA